MNKALQVVTRFRPDAGRLLLSLLLGAGGGLFISSYWLTELLPAGSRQLQLFTLVTGLAATPGYYFWINWISRQFRSLTGSSRLGLIAFSIVAGLLLLFGGTSQWLSPAQYVTVLLPSHRLDLSAVSASTADRAVAIAWFNTSLGDVSYDALELQGWVRKGDELILQNPGQNELRWLGKSGEIAQIVLRGSSAGDQVRITWDDADEVIVLKPGQTTYVHTFVIPWYASRAFVLFLGFAAIASLILALAVIVWTRREVLGAEIERAFASTSERLGRTEGLLLFAAAILALSLRLPNLGTLFPAVDEYYHLIAARQIVEGAALSSVYPRSLWVVTIPISLSLRIFGNEFWAARIVGVIVNVLAIIPLYLLGRRVSRPVGVLAILLYATSPWIVTFARIAREYAYYPFYFYWIVLGMMVFLEKIPPGFVLLRDWRKLANARTILLALALIVPPLFALYGDITSTFRTIWIAYPIFAVFLLSKFDFKNRRNLPMVVAWVGTFALVARRWYLDQKDKVSLLPSYNSQPVEYFLPNPPQQWYFDRLALIIVLGLIAAVICARLVYRRNGAPAFLLALHGTSLAVFALFATSFYHTRHLSSTELWYVLAVAMALYLVWKGTVLLLPWKNRAAQIVLMAALGISVLNVNQILTPITSRDPDNPISEDYLHDLTEVHTFMLSNAEPDDVLISTVYGLYSSWREAPPFAEKYRITTQTPKDEILAIIEQHESGWVVIDKIRLALSALGPEAFAGIRDVEYIGLFGDEHVWHWRNSSGAFERPGLAGKGQ